MQLPSKELLREVLGVNVKDIYKIGSNPNLSNNILPYSIRGCGDLEEINIYELAHKNLKQWAKLKNIFDIIDWSEEPEQIFKKVEKIRNEIN